MGHQSSRRQTLSDHDIKIFSQRSQLQPHVVQQLYGAFRGRVDRDELMTIEEFKKIYADINPNADLNNLDDDAERTFMIFDSDRDGLLTFDEFLMGFVLLQHFDDEPSDQIDHVMNSMPSGIFSRPGYLNYAEILMMLQHIHRINQESTFDPYTERNRLWDQLNDQIDSFGFVPQTSFIRLLNTNSHILPKIF